MNESTLNKTKNYFRAIGTVYEVALTREDCEIKKKDKDGNDIGVINGERVRGTVAIRTDNGVITCRAFFQSHNSKPNKDGKYENNRWAMATSMLDWEGEINGNGGEPTLVNIEGTIDVNDYLGNDGNVKSAVQLNIGKATTKVSPDEAHGCSWNGVVYIKSINPEVISEEETGRLIVDLLGVNSRSEVFPIKAIVEENLAEDFEDSYDVEQTVPMDIDVVVRHVGQKQQKQKAFGRGGTVNVNNGFDVTEFIIVGADEAIEESEDEDDDGNVIDNGWLNPKSIKKAIKEREKKLEEIKNASPVEKKSGVKAEKEKAKMAKTRANNGSAFNEEEDELF